VPLHSGKQTHQYYIKSTNKPTYFDLLQIIFREFYNIQVSLKHRRITKYIDILLVLKIVDIKFAVEVVRKNVIIRTFGILVKVY